MSSSTISGVSLHSASDVFSSMVSSMTPQEHSAVDSDLLDFSEDTIIVIVGPELEKYTVHAGQLKKSRFFESALKDPWLVNRSISLPTDDPVMLHCYFHFLYASRVPTSNDEELAAMYVYGEKVVDLRFKHAVTKAIIRLTRTVQEDGKCYYPVTKAVNCIYEGTLDGSPARQLLSDIFSVYGTPSWIGDYEYDAGFLKDLVLKRIREHEDGEEIIYGHKIVADRCLERHVPEMIDGVEMAKK